MDGEAAFTRRTAGLERTTDDQGDGVDVPLGDSTDAPWGLQHEAPSLRGRDPSSAEGECREEEEEDGGVAVLEESQGALMSWVHRSTDGPCISQKWARTNMGLSPAPAPPLCSSLEGGD